MKAASLALLLATGALAAPGTKHRLSRIAEKIARRGVFGHSRSSNPFIQVEEPISLPHDIQADYQSTNWAGAAKSESGFTAVTADTRVPTPRVPSGGSRNTAYYASAWVGLDGYICENAILQTGFDIAVEGSETEFYAWYEWYPDYEYNFSLELSEGDDVRMTVDASSTTSGTATVENLSTGQSQSHSFSRQPSLCETDVEWIVERFTEVSSNGQESLVPFADYDSYTFTNCAATQDGSSVGLSGADMIVMTEGRSTVSQCTVESDSELVCNYTG